MRRNALIAVAAVLSLLAAGTVAAAVTVGSTAASDGDAGYGRQITVAGEGSASADPDQAVVRIAVVATGDDPAAISDELASGADALRTALADVGVPDEALETATYDISERPRRGPDDGREALVRGEHGFEVTLDDTNRTGAVIDAAAGTGAEISGVRFTLADDTRDALRDQALTAAMADADRKASTLANASDLTVTGVGSIDATERSFEPVQLDMAASFTSGDAGTAVETGQVDVSTSVTVVYNATG